MGNVMMYAQEIEPKEELNIDDLGEVSDEFQENFFEALMQKAITNYDKAIKALEKCIEIDAEPIFLYSELGKNYLALKVYEKAEENLKKVLEAQPNNRYVLELLYEVYFQQRNYKASIKIVERLVPFDSMFKEQLANLYFLEKRYDDALEALDQLNDEYGVDNYRTQLRKRITAKITNPDSRIAILEKKIKKNPKSEQNYLNLIYIYSQNNQSEKAFETARQLQKVKPNSELVHLALYKFYLQNNDDKAAMNSMQIALQSKKVDTASKFKIISDFLPFLDKNPEYEIKLSEIMSLIDSNQDNAKVFTALGHFYYKKDQKEQALNFYERGIKSNASDFALLRRILLLQLDLKRYEKAAIGSQMALEMYPAQPIFYLVNGVSLIHSDKAEEAIEILSLGIDYIIDNQKMESDFYTQMSMAYEKLGNTTKASEYQQKASQLQKNQNG
ncbi:tetratricopeptide repeat protein [Aquimarina sp. U1-2]|uniref:tetratricopeptide repeat protein n=1 Tax=Aquimarina sp. U1-2 TaxID=2823141 RepID=UPI001AECFD26|nr:tetratricopeptide repeat protein [Aquimarina sp. U1-2]MBP2833322.1 tetratricopeptide repeat protein [Aquimarina sp. U1-2]